MIVLQVLEYEKVKILMKNNKRERHSKIFIISVILIILLCILVAGYFLFNDNLSIKDIETIKDSVVMLKIYDKDNKEISTGSGFCVYQNNYILTNYHVIEGANKIKIKTDTSKYDITDILIFNEKNDLALLKGNFNLVPLKINPTNTLKAGDAITAIGSPKGELNTVSTGVISNCDDNYQIRITAPISPRK